MRPTVAFPTELHSNAWILVAKCDDSVSKKQEADLVFRIGSPANLGRLHFNNTIGRQVMNHSLNAVAVVITFVIITLLSIAGFVLTEGHAIVVALSTGLIGGLAGYCVGYVHAEVCRD